MAPPKLPELLALLEGAKSSPERLQALRKIARLGKDAAPAAEVVARCLEDEDNGVVEYACSLLRDFGSKITEPMQSRLLALAADETRPAKLRAQAAWALQMAQNKATSLEVRTREALHAAPRGLHQHLAGHLAALSPTGFTATLDFFENSPAAIFNALYEKGQKLAEHRERIEEWTRHRKPNVRLNALKLIARMGEQCGPSLLAICAVLTNDKETDEVRDGAVHACLDLRRHARTPEVASALVHLLQASTLPKVHQFYASYFMQRALEEQGPSMVEILEPMATHPDAHVRRAVVGVITAIKQRMKDGDFEDHNTLDEEVEQLITQSTMEPEELSQQPATAVEVADTVEEPEADDEDEDEGDDEDADEGPRKPRQTIKADDDAGAALILAALKDPDRRVRMEAAELLRDFAPAGVQHIAIAERLLVLVAETTQEAELGNMVEALGSLPPTHPGVLDALRRALTHERERIRWSACHGARAMGPGAAPLIPELLVLVEHRLGGEDTEYPGWSARFDPRMDALKAIADINTPGPDTIAMLQRVGSALPAAGYNDNWSRWVVALELLVKWGGITDELRAIVIGQVNAADSSDRAYAARVCGAEGWKPNPEIAKALAERLKKERTKQNQIILIRALRVHAPHASGAVPKLEAYAKNGIMDAAETLLAITPNHAGALEALHQHLLKELDTHAVMRIAKYPAAIQVAAPTLRKMVNGSGDKASIRVLAAQTLAKGELADQAVKKLLKEAAAPTNPLRLPIWQFRAVQEGK